MASRSSERMRVLLVQTSFLGDTILSTPLIEALLKIHPNAELWALTTPASSELIRLDPLLSGVITFDKRGADRGIGGLLKKARVLQNLEFDTVYSLHRSWRTSLLLWLSKIKRRIGFRQSALSFLYHERVERILNGHEVERNLSLLSPYLGTSSPSGELRLIPPDESSLSNSVSSLGSLKRSAVVFPGSAWKTKMWKWEGFRDAARHLIDQGYTVILLGSSNEREVADRIQAGIPEGESCRNLAGEVSIRETMFLVSRASLVLSNDSMALHLASAFKVPSIAVFCATSPEFGFGPWKNKARVVEKEGLSCKPCRRHGSNSCPNGTERCMKDLGSDKVIEAIKEVA